MVLAPESNIFCFWVRTIQALYIFSIKEKKKKTAGIWQNKSLAMIMSSWYWPYCVTYYSKIWKYICSKVPFFMLLRAMKTKQIKTLRPFRMPNYSFKIIQDSLWMPFDWVILFGNSIVTVSVTLGLSGVSFAYGKGMCSVIGKHMRLGAQLPESSTHQLCDLGERHVSSFTCKMATIRAST